MASASDAAEDQDLFRKRVMASVKQVDEVFPIENADAIECAMIGGWSVVIKKNEYKQGDFAIYCEIDSWVPHIIAPYLTPAGKEPHEFNGIKGERLRTKKIRGQLSQGLLLPLSLLPDSSASPESDVSDMLGIQKYEDDSPPELEGTSKNSRFPGFLRKSRFPGFLRKTDQARIQNSTTNMRVWHNNPCMTWEVTEKLDGSSMTVYFRNGQHGVCSRNFDVELPGEEDLPSSFWNAAIAEDLIEKVKALGRNIAIQGELIGPPISGNKYKLPKRTFYLFDVYDIDAGKYLKPEDRRAIAAEMGIKHVPLIHASLVITQTTAEILKMAEGKSALNARTEREGLVFKSNQFGGPSFKAVSNRWLLKHEE